MKKILLSTFTLFLATVGFAQDPCLTWVSPTNTGGWTDFTSNFGGAPCNDGTGCPFNEIQDFEVFESEAYVMANVVMGGSYTFSHCNGPGAGTWVPEYTIIAPSSAVDAFGPGDGDGCSITWTASESGDYLIVINEADSCGFAGTNGNGFPAITCNGTPECPPEPEDCLTWVSPSPTTGWSDFNTAFMGAPVPVDEVCPFNEIQDFEVWKSEAYAMDNMVAGTCYTFSHCNGPGAGSWVPDYTIIAPSGAIDAAGAGDGDGCSITFVASESGSYLIVINEEGECGVSAQIDNGFPAMTCNASTCGSISVEEIAEASFNIFPNPNAGQFVIDYQGVNGLAQIEVFEISGKTIVSNQVNVTTGSRIDMNLGSVKGMYFVRITMNNQSQVHKVVIN